MVPQPPGPGLGEQAPSVKISTTVPLSSVTSVLRHVRPVKATRSSSPPRHNNPAGAAPCDFSDPGRWRLLGASHGSCALLMLPCSDLSCAVSNRSLLLRSE